MPEAIMVVDLLDHKITYSPVETTLSTKVQWTSNFIHIKAVLGLHLAVNEKSQRCYTYLASERML